MTDLQVKLLGIYKEIKRICEKHNIAFYADGGTKLGAVRHGGFIPWDDDMDIAMKLEDYNTFKKVICDELREPYEVFDGSVLDHVDFSFLKVSDKSTTFIRREDLPFPENYMGVHIDIFPYIGTDSSDSEKAFNKKLDLLVDEITSRKLYGFGRTLPVLAKEQERLQRKFDVEHSKYIRNSTTSMWRDSAIFLTSGYEGSIEMPFEDTFIPVPVGYKRQLKDQYGDYMKLPPEDKRVSHHHGIADLQVPHQEYSKSFSKAPFKDVLSYTHTLQINTYKLEHELINLEERNAEELKHKEYFISEAERKYEEARREIDAIKSSRTWQIISRLKRTRGDND